MLQEENEKNYESSKLHLFHRTNTLFTSVGQILYEPCPQLNFALTKISSVSGVQNKETIFLLLYEQTKNEIFSI